jgi:hypothetical protein
MFFEVGWAVDVYDGRREVDWWLELLRKDRRTKVHADVCLPF